MLTESVVRMRRSAFVMFMGLEIAREVLTWDFG
jgi:hypothetical protein